MSVLAPTLDRDGRTHLHYAALDGRLRDVEAAITARDDVDLADTPGFTALHFAAQGGHAAIVEVLLASGADIEARNKFGNTPLWVAVMSARDGDGAALTALLAAGADPDAANDSGTILREATHTRFGRALGQTRQDKALCPSQPHLQRQLPSSG